MEEKAKAKEEFTICSRCGKSKPLSEFYKNKTTKSGHQSACKECKRGYNKEYNKNHKEEKREYTKKYNKNHKEERCEYNKKYRQTEAGRIIHRLGTHHRRARKARANGEGISAEQWSRIIAKQRNKCNRCSKRFTNSRLATMDHIIPLSKGGDDDSSNIQALCNSCDCTKHTKIQNGLIVYW